MKHASRREFLNLSGKYTLAGLGLAPVVSALLSGCAELEQVVATATDAANQAGLIDASSADVVKTNVRTAAKSFEDITPEQEYYIGRAVAANILKTNRPCGSQAATSYINVLGQTLAQASDMPETFGGYHFMILDADTINAFAAPGGLIFVTRGMLRCCRHEDAVAAVLAHEISHVNHKHGLQSIKNSRITSALTSMAIAGASAMTQNQLGALTKDFEGAIYDTTTTLVNSGYSRSFEVQADSTAVTIMKRVGYSPRGMIDMLSVMQERLKPGGLDFAKTHPSPSSRISVLQQTAGGFAAVSQNSARQTRFTRALESM